ncbi:MAG: hypothetical protein M3O07_01970 [Pseudomonadota bacterium]|nr:hypothetical protein [Pseudomonadota bacterium]
MRILIVLIAVTGCDVVTDAATRLAYVRHQTPSASGQCTGPYTVQLDKVGAIIIWCKDASGETVSSHSTSYHGRYVDTPTTHLLDKEAGSTLTVDLERRSGRAIVTDVR